MAKPATVRSYFRVRRRVDKEISTHQQYALPVWAANLLAILMLVGAYHAGPLTLAIFWFLVAPFWAIWTVFVIWRVSRLIRADVIRGDRQYDRRGKYLLPPEYAHTKSITAINRRARKFKTGRSRG